MYTKDQLGQGCGALLWRGWGNESGRISAP